MENTIAEIFQGLDNWQKCVKVLRQKRIKILVVRTDNDNIEISGNKICVPPCLETLFKQLLQESNAG